jgi:hypothetical protein
MTAKKATVTSTARVRERTPATPTGVITHTTP